MPIFVLDFFLNFLKIQSLDSGYLADPLSIAAHYLKYNYHVPYLLFRTQFTFDLVAMIPYHVIYRAEYSRDGHLIHNSTAATVRFLRLARISRFVQSAKNLIVFFEKACSNYASWIKKKTVNNISSVIW